jgi:hypothetical protein
VECEALLVRGERPYQVELQGFLRDLRQRQSRSGPPGRTLQPGFEVRAECPRVAREGLGTLHLPYALKDSLAENLHFLGPGHD